MEFLLTVIFECDKIIDLLDMVQIGELYLKWYRLEVVLCMP